MNTGETLIPPAEEPASNAPPAGNEPPAGDPPANEAPERPEWLPEKFWSPEGPSVEKLAKSYVELERLRGKSLDDLKAEWEGERLSVRPADAAGYALPDIEVLDASELAASPIVAAFREIAFNAGMSQDQFNEGLAAYAKAEVERLDARFQQEMAALGENAKVRTEAVGLWARKTFGDGPKLAAIEQVCTTAAGIEAMELVMAALRDNGGEVPSDEPGDAGDTDDSIRQLMQQPAYWDGKRRDPAVVKRVEDFFAKKYSKP